MTTDVSIQQDDPTSEHAAALMRELAAEEAESCRDLGSDDRDSLDAAQAGATGGAFVVARLNGEPVGCGALRPIDAEAAEIKTMYVAPNARRLGIGRAMLAELQRLALDLGYRILRLETGGRQAAAIALYERFGFRRFRLYGEHFDAPDSICFEKPIMRDISCLILPVKLPPEFQAFRRAETHKPHSVALHPHVSILAPILPDEVDEPALPRIARAANSHPAIDCTFSQFGVFPDASFMFLSPYPVAPFESLQSAIVKELPTHSPAFTEPVFHLSLAGGFELSTLPALMSRAHALLDRFLPLKATLRQLYLVDRRDGVWNTRACFRLGI